MEARQALPAGQGEAPHRDADVAAVAPWDAAAPRAREFPVVSSRPAPPEMAGAGRKESVLASEPWLPEWAAVSRAAPWAVPE